MGVVAGRRVGGTRGTHDFSRGRLSGRGMQSTVVEPVARVHGECRAWNSTASYRQPERATSRRIERARRPRAVGTAVVLNCDTPNTAARSSPRFCTDTQRSSRERLERGRQGADGAGVGVLDPAVRGDRPRGPRPDERGDALQALQFANVRCCPPRDCRIVPHGVCASDSGRPEVLDPTRVCRRFTPYYGLPVSGAIPPDGGRAPALT